MKYAVTVVRTGTIWVEAATPAEAMQIADCQDTEDIDWCDEWAVTDCEEDECPELHDYTMRTRAIVAASSRISPQRTTTSRPIW